MKYSKADLLARVLLLERRLERLEQRFLMRQVRAGLGSRKEEIRKVSDRDEPPEEGCLPVDA